MTLTRRAAPGARVAALLMVISVGGCDNVEWGGMDAAVVPPPPKTAPIGGDIEAGERLPQGPILYHVTRDSARVTMIPVGEVTDQRLRPIEPGDDPESFGEAFITTFLRSDAEFTLFRNGRRAGTLIVESAGVPGPDACRPLPRATGSLELSGGAGDATEFLAMARTQAPEGRMLAAGSLEPQRRMQVVGPILAERTLRARDVPLPNWSRALQQIQPFPVAGTQEPGFTATFLSGDVLEVGHDDDGYSLFIVYTPQAQTGYDTAYVDFTSYTASGKAAPRVIDFLDWNRDGNNELLLEVFGTRNRWYEAVGIDDEDWGTLFEDRCDQEAEAPPDAGAPDTTSTAAPAASPTRPGAPPRQPGPDTNQATLFPDVEPVIQLSNPLQRLRPTRRDSQTGSPGGG